MLTNQLFIFIKSVPNAKGRICVVPTQCKYQKQACLILIKILIDFFFRVDISAAFNGITFYAALGINRCAGYFSALGNIATENIVVCTDIAGYISAGDLISGVNVSDNIAAICTVT